MKRLTLSELIVLMRDGFHVEVQVLLGGGLYSRHELSLEGSTVVDLSFVDGCTTRSSVAAFIQNSIVAQAAQRNNLILEQKWG